ncbi:1,4-alpha-glucan branching protein GlgB [Verticiella alkaliphila]|uniref:1,4-alpha-glucan branching protein GlgB n=1 Tax=Verticiella alkaliphila TaxID=2779529 RepID=UPI00353025DC
MNEALERDIDALMHARHADPFAVLGPHDTENGREIRAWMPGAVSIEAVAADGEDVQTLHAVRDGFFRGAGPQGTYRLRVQWPHGTHETEDPYAFGNILDESDLHAFREGRHGALDERLGAHACTWHGVAGTRFAVWAPNARRVSVVGDFNSWDGRRHPMRLRFTAGVWELFLPGVGPGSRYKFEILGAHGGVSQRADPFARQTEAPPGTASIVVDPTPFAFTDAEWMAQRAERHALDAPISIYEVHAGSWRREDGRELNWHALADRLVPYVKALGFTHIELMPIMEHPFGGSWGYQPLGLFAPTARYGSPADFAYFVNACHAAHIGVILDWVPAHFPNDAHGLVEFDGTALFEHADPREGYHPDWNTMIYNLGRNEVRNFMIASGIAWLQRFHVDGLRVDAVASMLYRDYSRKAGEWVPNIHGGRENLESITFLQALNEAVDTRCPGAITIAEESTAWPGVTAPVRDGGLGFHYKWNMGWMHDTLHYLEQDPIHRRFHHHHMTFGLVYAWSEHFVLPLSHDEVVHGKGSLLGKMPGDDWQRFANLRAYFGFLWTHPGKKLLFMGGEIAQRAEWNHDAELAWNTLDDPRHRGVQHLVRDLNRVYRELPALHQRDANPDGFAWVVGDDSTNSVLAYLRQAPGTAPVLVVVNLTPVPRGDYRIGVPHAGFWAERLNSDADLYGGSGMGNAGGRATDDVTAHGFAQSLSLVLPPLSTLILQLEGFAS